MKRKRRLLPKNNRELILDRDNRECVYCGGTGDLAVDHIVPIVLGGSDCASNLIASCRSCNATKNGNRLLPRFEKEMLDYAAIANSVKGIDGNTDMSFSIKKKEKRRMMVRAARKPKGRDVDKPRIKNIERIMNIIFSQYEVIYFSRTETKADAKRFSNRIRKRNGKHISIPCNDDGGRLFLTDLFDQASSSMVITQDVATKSFLPFRNFKNGYLSGNMHYASAEQK